jgi:V/A-type H+-transporting ATPase subunit C
MDLSYAYANARIKGMKSNLLGENVFRELMQVKTLDEITALLEQTPYKQDLVEASKQYHGVQRIDVALHKNLARTFATVGRILPPSGRKLFAFLNAEWDAQNLKLILSKKALGEEIRAAELLGAVKGSFYEKLLKTKNPQEAVELIAIKWGSGEFGRRMKKLLASQGGRDAGLFRSAIQEIEREKVKELVLLSQSSDALTKKIVEQQLAVENAMIVLRLKREGVKNIGKFVLYKSAFINSLLNAGDFDEALKMTASEFSLTQETVAKARESLSALEIALERKAVEKTMRLTRLSVLSFATAVGFVFLKNVEVSNLRKIAYANAFDLKQELGEQIFAINA